MTPDQGVTSGSQSHPANFNHSNLAQAGATARQALLQSRLETLEHSSRPTHSRRWSNSRSKSDAAKKVSYGELVAGKKFDLKLDPKAQRKPASEWTVLGKADAASRYARHGYWTI